MFVKDIYLYTLTITKRLTLHIFYDNFNLHSIQTITNKILIANEEA